MSVGTVESSSILIIEDKDIDAEFI